MLATIEGEVEEKCLDEQHPRLEHGRHGGSETNGEEGQQSADGPKLGLWPNRTKKRLKREFVEPARRGRQ